MTLKWDSSPSPDVDHYVLYWGQASGIYTANSGDIGLATEFTATLQDGKRYYFAVKAFDGDGVGSAFSDEITFHPQTTVLTSKYYTDILDRNPGPGEAEAWAAEIERAVVAGIDVDEGFIALARIFFNSAEYILKNPSDTEYVIDLYQTFFSRQPNQGETDYWKNYLHQGLTRNGLLNWFAFSQEFSLDIDDIFGYAADRKECNLINDFYRGLLNRLPDTPGFNAYLDLMATAMATGDQAVRELSHIIAWGFINSLEYAYRDRDDSQFLADLYDAILRRGAQPSELGYWENQMAKGMTRDEVLYFFVNSQEFQLRIKAICDSML